MYHKPLKRNRRGDSRIDRKTKILRRYAPLNDSTQAYAVLVGQGFYSCRHQQPQFHNL